jgi:sugar (pentulose or hexulose) kinase
MGKYILGIDAGTSVVKCCIMDLEGNELGTAARKVPIDVPAPNWAVEDMWLVWGGVTEIVPEAFEKTGLTGSDIAAIGVTGQGDGNWMVDKNGEPIQKAILWTDGRAGDILNEWMRDGIVEEAYKLTGTGPYPGSANSIMRWQVLNAPDMIKKAYKNLWSMDWIQYKLTGNMSTDASNTSLFGLDIRKRQYSDEVLKLYGLYEVKHLLPEIVDSTEIMGYVHKEAADKLGLVEGTPVVKGMFDMVASATGVGCVNPGEACTILGTTCGNEVVTSEPVFDPPNVGMNLCHGIPTAYVKAMGVNYGTPNLDWFLREFGMPYQLEAEKRGVNVFQVLDEVLQRTPVGSAGIVYSPYLCPGGERAPFVKTEARAQFFGLTEENTRDQMLRSVYEGIGLSMRDCYDCIPVDLKSIALCGGGAKSDIWCQMLSDIVGQELYVPEGTEFGAKGVAMFAGVAVGLFSDINDAVKKTLKVNRRFQPNLDNTKKYDGLFKVYRKLRDDVFDTWDLADAARKAL